MFSSVYSCMFTNLYPSLVLFTFLYACLVMFTYVYTSLPILTRDYLFLVNQTRTRNGQSIELDSEKQTA